MTKLDIKLLTTKTPQKKHLKTLLYSVGSELDLTKSNSETNENWTKTEILTKTNNIAIEFTAQFLKSHFIEKMVQPYILTLYSYFFALLKAINLTTFTPTT